MSRDGVVKALEVGGAAAVGSSVAVGWLVVGLPLYLIPLPMLAMVGLAYAVHRALGWWRTRDALRHFSVSLPPEYEQRLEIGDYSARLPGSGRRSPPLVRTAHRS